MKLHQFYYIFLIVLMFLFVFNFQKLSSRGVSRRKGTSRASVESFQETLKSAEEGHMMVIYPLTHYEHQYFSIIR